MPTGIGVIDLMLELPTDDRGTWYDFMRPLLMDAESRELFKMPAEYMFKAVPTVRDSDDYIGIALDEMDKHGIAKAMISVRFGNPLGARALKEHPDRFIGSYAVDPNLGMEGVRELRKAVEVYGVKAATAFPAGCVPRSPSTTRSSTRSTPRAWTSTSRSSSAPACPGRGCRCFARTSR
jgi:hypothetical protein